MNHLSKINKWVWGVFIFIITALVSSTYFIFTRKIERYISVNLVVSKTGIDKLMMRSEDTILINKSSKIRLKLQQKYFDVSIEEFEDKNNGKTEITLREKIPEFTSGTMLEARIIYSSISVWEKIIER